MSEKKKFNFEEFSDKLLDKLMPFIDLFNKPYPRALQVGFTSLIPILTFGSLVLLINMLSLPGSFKEGLTILPFLTRFSPQMTLVYYFTFSFIAVPAVYFIANSYAKELEVEDRLTGGLAILCLLAATTTSLDEVGGLPLAGLGSGSLFTAMIVALVFVRITKFCYDHNINIKMPPEVPPAVADTFKVVVPFAITMLIFLAMNAAGINLNNLIVSIFTPILRVGDNVFSFCLWKTLSNILWFFGIHGDNAFASIVSPLQTQWTLENTAAYVAGEALPHIWTDYLMRVDMTSYAIIAVILLFCKSKQLRTVAKVSLPCIIFNIGEPILFGIPLVMNPFLFIPHLIASVGGFAIAYLGTALGVIGRMRMSMPWVLPNFIGYPIATGSLVGSIVILGLAFALGFVVYLPFLKMYDKKLVAEETGEAEAE